VDRYRRFPTGFGYKAPRKVGGIAGKKFTGGTRLLKDRWNPRPAFLLLLERVVAGEGGAGWFDIFL